MKSSSSLPIHLMWEATIKCDQAYDGQFFYAVKTTRIFCRPSCKSKTPNIENICFFNRSKDAIKQGFRPCKRCNPEQLSYYNPQQSIVNEVIEYLEKNFQYKITLFEIATHIGVSPYHLNRTFKEKQQMTPHQYLENIRINKAQQQLIFTDLSVTEICFEVGYNNFSSFYRQFNKISGCSPPQYRKKNIIN